MSAIEHEWPRDSQPQDEVDLDRGGEFFNNLVVAAPFNPSLPMRDLVSGRSITATGLGSRIATANGLYHSFGSSNYADLPQPPEITSGTQPITIAWTQQPVATSGYSTILTWKVSGAAKPFLIYQSATDTAYYFTVGPRDGAGNAVKFGAAVGVVTNGALDKFLLVCLGGVSSTNASDYVLYRNGEAFTSADKAAFGNSSSTAFRVGATETGGDPFEGAIGDFCIWNEAFGAEKAQRYQNFQWRLYAPQTIWVPVSAGGSSISAAVSASAAIQAARNATASVNAAIQASQSASASVNAAVAQARTVQAALDAAVLQARSTTASVDAAVQQAMSNTASVDGVIQAIGSASSGVDAAVQAGQSATTSVNAYVQAGAGLVASIDAYIQAGSSEVASVDAVIQQARTGNMTIDAVVSRALSASASLAAAVLEHRSATASINAYIQAGTTIGAGIEAAIQAQQSASASINAAVSLARSASTSLAAVIAVHASVGAAVDAAVLEARYGAIGVGAYIYDPTVIVIRYPSATRQIHTERQPRAIATGRINRSIQS